MCEMVFLVNTRAAKSAALHLWLLFLYLTKVVQIREAEKVLG